MFFSFDPIDRDFKLKYIILRGSSYGGSLVTEKKINLKVIIVKKIVSILMAFSVAAVFSIGAFASSLGDINADGQINSYDALLVLKHSVGNESEDFVFENADVNGDSQINSADALTILRVSVGLDTIENDRCTDPDGHSWGNWDVITEPTETTDGKMKRICENCGRVETEIIPKLSATVSKNRQEILRLVNIERAKEGLSPLKYYFPGQAAADIRAKEIATKFSHERPDGTMCFSALDEQNIDYYSAGENILIGLTDPQAVVNAWMNSPGHRANILSANFNYLVVGVDGAGWVQLFIGI